MKRENKTSFIRKAWMGLAAVLAFAMLLQVTAFAAAPGGQGTERRIRNDSFTFGGRTGKDTEPETEGRSGLEGLLAGLFGGKTDVEKTVPEPTKENTEPTKENPGNTEGGKTDVEKTVLQFQEEAANTGFTIWKVVDRESFVAYRLEEIMGKLLHPFFCCLA